MLHQPITAAPEAIAATDRAEYYPTCTDCGSASQGTSFFGFPYCGLCEREIRVPLAPVVVLSPYQVAA